jgi:hypothetical protein
MSRARCGSHGPEDDRVWPRTPAGNNDAVIGYLARHETAYLVVSADAAEQPPVDMVAASLVALHQRSRRCLAEMTRIANEIRDLQRKIDAHVSSQRPRVQPPPGLRAARAAQ